MAFEEEFQVPPENTNEYEKIVTVSDILDFIFRAYSRAQLPDTEITANVVALRVNNNGTIEVGFRGTDGTWTLADRFQRLPTGIYVAVFNRWGEILKELEDLVNDQNITEAALQDFFERYPDLLRGDKYDKIVPQAVICPDDRGSIGARTFFFTRLIKWIFARC